MVKKIALVFVLVWFVFILFMPKEQIYFKIEQELAKHDIVLNEESRSEGIFSLSLENVTVYIKGIPLITLKEVEFCTFLFYSSINLETIVIDESLKAFTPTTLDNAQVSHMVLMPLDLHLEVNGPFGQANGNADMKERILRIDVEDIQALEMLSAKLKQGEEGWYYETSF